MSEYRIQQKAAYAALPFFPEMTLNIEIMSFGIIKPTEREIGQWIVHTAAHAYHIEYFLQRLQIGSEDPDRPHDLMHTGNKFEWPAIKGLALQFRENGNLDFHQQVMASREYHRQQFHHRMWNQYYPNATEDAMKLGAVEAICLLLEPREIHLRYQNF